MIQVISIGTTTLLSLVANQLVIETTRGEAGKYLGSRSVKLSVVAALY